MIPTLEEILPKLSGAKLFSIVDAKCGHWNVELDEESSFLTTFNSPFGRHGFLRMPFGLKMSRNVLQEKIDQIKFYGVMCSKKGVQPDPAKVSALKNMAPPSDIQKLQAFLGLATYKGPFIQNHILVFEKNIYIKKYQIVIVTYINSKYTILQQRPSHT